MKSKKFVKSAACVTAVVLGATMLTACGSTKPAELAEGAVIALTDELSQKTALTVNGTEITAGEMQYYIYNAAMITIYGIDKEFDGNIDGFDWNQKVDGKPIEEVIIETAVENAVSDCVTVQKGKENGISLSDDDLAQLDDSISQYKEQFGDEAYTLSMNSMAITDADGYKKLYQSIVGAQLVDEDIESDFDKYASDKDSLKKYKSNDMVTAQHILITSDSEKFENPEEEIKKVLERAKAGEDFNALMEEFNEDPGETAAGYTFGPGEMVQEFEDAAFALDYDEISDVVKTDYGYHIIKRLVGTAELKNSWAKDAKVKKNSKILDSVSVKNIVKAASNASEKIQEMSQTATSSAAEDTDTAAEGE